MIVFVRISKNQQKNPKRISNYSNVAGYEVNIQNSILLTHQQ